MNEQNCHFRPKKLVFIVAPCVIKSRMPIAAAVTATATTTSSSSSSSKG
jgi:hypothetical protein